MPRYSRRLSFAFSLHILACCSSCAVAEPFRFEWPSSYGQIESDVQSEFSHIRVRKRDQQRSLLFVRDNGDEVVESIVDIGRPHALVIDYTRLMFSSYLFQPKVENVLIVGLGGGSMVSFLKHYDPNVKVDVVEIDPAIVKIADQYFGVRSEGNVNVITGDGMKYLTTTKSQYDVIYMDAFLKPSEATDVNGVPLNLKTLQFYKKIQERLTPGGVVVYNLNPHARTKEDIATIKRAFPQVYVFRLSDSPGFVAVATMAPRRETAAALVRGGKELDKRFKATFSFQGLAGRLVQ